MRSTVRSLVLSLHRWIGLAIGLPVVFIATMGAIMVFKPQLEPMTERGLLRVPACSERVALDLLAANARKAFSAGRMEYVRIFGGANEAVQVRFRDHGVPSNVYLDPCTGEVIGQKNRYGGFFGSVEALHLLMFLDGYKVAGGTVALLLVFAVAGGLTVWWPANWRALQASVKINRRLAGRARTLNHHRTIGFYASIILLMSALSGTTMAFDWAKNLVQRLTGSPVAAARPQSAEPAAGQRLPIEGLWRHARRLVENPADALVIFPQKPRDPVTIELLAPDAPYPAARSRVYFDAYSGEVLGFVPYASRTTGDKVLGWTLALHTGEVGGLIGQLLLFAAALSVPYLAYTGISSYLRRKFLTTASTGAAPTSTKKVVIRVGAHDGPGAFTPVPSCKPPPFSAGSQVDRPAQARDSSRT